METLQASGTVQGVFFSLGTTPAANDPKFDCANAVISLFNQAKKTAHVAIYSLTEPNIVDAIIAANKRGVKVAIVADATESKNANMAVMIKKYTHAGVDVCLAIRQTALMHIKWASSIARQSALAASTGRIMQRKITMRTCWL